jgi:hypothetical protein
MRQKKFTTLFLLNFIAATNVSSSRIVEKAGFVCIARWQAKKRPAVSGGPLTITFVPATLEVTEEAISRGPKRAS